VVPPLPVLLLPSPLDVAADDLDGPAGSCQRTRGIRRLVPKHRPSRPAYFGTLRYFPSIFSQSNPNQWMVLFFNFLTDILMYGKNQ
jgi:hypothetical protein